MYYPQAHGRYSLVPYYIPVPSQLYPNYPVDPNHPWIPAPPYGNAPLINGRQSETEGSEHDSSVDDERSGATSYPPPGVGLPATSTMQQQPVYQMMPQFSNMYVSSIPSGVNVQGYMNSPIPYPHPYQGMATGGEMGTQQTNSNRGNRGSSKTNTSGKMSNDKGNGAMDSSFNSQASAAGQESGSASDQSPHTMQPAMGGPPPHPTNFLPIGPVQYSYPYFHQTGPPPQHMTTAQHATGSPLYIPQMPVYPHMSYSGPAAVYSTDNGMPHSVVSTAAVSMNQPLNELSANNHESELCNYSTKENSLDENYKNPSNLMADSPPFEHHHHHHHHHAIQKNGTGCGGSINFLQENVSTSSDMTDNISLPNNSDQSIPSEVPCSTDKEESVTEDNFATNDNSISSCDTASGVDQPVDKRTDGKVENITSMLNHMRTAEEKKGCIEDVYKNVAVTIDVAGNENEIKTTDAKIDDSELSESKTNSNENVNGKMNTSQDSISSGFESGAKSPSTELKCEANEEADPALGKKTWASLFKASPSPSSKIKAPTAASKSSHDMCNNTAAYTNSNSDHYSAITSSNSSSYNGLHSNQSHGKPSYKYTSNTSLADDAALPKIGELLKNYKLDHRAINFEPRGLENRSNYCYVNAILQALLACPPFYNLMKCVSHNLHNSRTKSKQHFPIIDSMVQFVDEFKPIPQKSRMARDKTRRIDAMSHQEITPGKPFEPGSMLAVIQNNSQFTLGQQEDAQEFLMCLLNGLNDEMVELIQLAEGNPNGLNSRKSLQQQTVKVAPMKNNKKISNGDIASEVNAPDDSDSEWKKVHSKAKSNRPNNLALARTPLSEIFRGQTRSRLQKIGDQTTNNIEPFFTLHLNIERVSSVKEALEALFGGQSALEGVTSSRTNQEVDAWQQQTLEELPYVLLLHLKYFDYKHHTCTKILKHTEFPIDLKLELKLISNQRSKTANMKSRQYKLFAVVYHDGKEATKGHYITDVFHIGCAGWIRYDDAKVTTVSENDVLKPHLPRVPYLLYYRRCDTIAALMQPPFEKR